MPMFREQHMAYKTLIDAALMSYLSKDGSLADGKYDIVKQAMYYSISAGGKKLRPILVIEFCKAFGGTAEQALPFACAIEMIHCYSLIHDDLPCMDDDQLRRGKPACHIRYGEANALLAGDALLTLAFEAIASAPEKTGLSVEAALRASLILARKSGMDGMVGGQVIDLMEEGNTLDEETLELLQGKKTSALICGAVALGCLAGGCTDEAVLRDAMEFGKELGFAFQIVDDILDVAGDENTLGKPIGSDAANHKTTYVSLFGIEKAKEIAALHTQRADELLKKVPNTQFLKLLTDRLLRRSS